MWCVFSSNLTWVKLKWFSVLPRTVIINWKEKNVNFFRFAKESVEKAPKVSEFCDSLHAR